MAKIKIKLVTVGHIPFRTNLSKIKKWNSSLFELPDIVESFSLKCNSDGPDWSYSDDVMNNVIPSEFSEDFLLAIVNIPLQENFYLRRLNGNRAVFTFHQIHDHLTSENIPLENAILRVLYECTLIYKRANGTIPSIETAISYTHDETRGCLFDMTGLKYELNESCNKPTICQECHERLIGENISNTIIKKCIEEISKIQKPLYYRLLDFIKQHPIWALALSTIYALIIGIIGSMLASAVYDKLK